MVLTLVFFAILFWQGWAMALRVQRQMLAPLDVSIAWVYAALPTGAVFIMVAVLGCMIRAAQGAWPPPDDEAPAHERPVQETAVQGGAAR
jgi:TRAP-type C4-dicarboxylate transport system permease small subunit